MILTLLTQFLMLPFSVFQLFFLYGRFVVVGTSVMYVGLEIALEICDVPLLLGVAIFLAGRFVVAGTFVVDVRLKIALEIKFAENEQQSVLISIKIVHFISLQNISKTCKGTGILTRKLLHKCC